MIAIMQKKAEIAVGINLIVLILLIWQKQIEWSVKC